MSLIIIVIVYYLFTMKRIAAAHRRVYADYARRFIAGVAGGATVLVGSQMSVISNSNDIILNKIIGIGVLFALMLSFVVLSLLLFVRIDLRTPPEERN